MNIYVRFFDQDILATNTTDLFNFLGSIPEIQLTPDLIADINDYIASDISYPKRYKIKARVYFILIKTNANTLEEFKENRLEKETELSNLNSKQSKKVSKVNALTEIKKGWYKAYINFKRVLLIPETGKFQYKDTEFEVLMKSDSPQNCYKRIIEYLRGREDIDIRSQFPSAKGHNFRFQFLGDDFSKINV